MCQLDGRPAAFTACVSSCHIHRHIMSQSSPHHVTVIATSCHSHRHIMSQSSPHGHAPADEHSLGSRQHDNLRSPHTTADCTSPCHTHMQSQHPVERTHSLARLPLPAAEAHAVRLVRGVAAPAHAPLVAAVRALIQALVVLRGCLVVWCPLLS
jgi:hypothetical protein